MWLKLQKAYFFTIISLRVLATKKDRLGLISPMSTSDDFNIVGTQDTSVFEKTIFQSVLHHP